MLRISRDPMWNNVLSLSFYFTLILHLRPNLSHHFTSRHEKKQKKMAGRSGSTIMESSAETRANLFRRVFKSSLTALDTNSFVELLGIELGIDLSGTSNLTEAAVKSTQIYTKGWKRLAKIDVYLQQIHQWWLHKTCLIANSVWPVCWNKKRRTQRHPSWSLSATILGAEVHLSWRYHANAIHSSCGKEAHAGHFNYIGSPLPNNFWKKTPPRRASFHSCIKFESIRSSH